MKMNKILIVLAAAGCLAGLLIALPVWRYVATVNASRKSNEALLQRIAPVLSELKDGRRPEGAAIEALAADAATRNLLYSGLRELGQTNLFPARFRSL